MAFVVWLDKPNESYVHDAQAHGGTPYGDADTYQFLHDGVLMVKKKADKTTTYYAPGVWHSVQTRNDHHPVLTARWAVNMARLPGPWR
ncbi:MAG TPA: hypothetical protein VH496_16355 [Mycobacterium sp.]|jgi:hypothetical protein